MQSRRHASHWGTVSMKDNMSKLGARLRQCMIEHHQFRDIADDDPRWTTGKQKADCLRDNPPIILEQKDIQQQDATAIFRLNEQVARCLQKYRHPMRDIMTQRMTWDKLDRQDFDRLHMRASRRIEKLFHKAAQQIRDTREVVGSWDAKGLLLVVNQLAGRVPEGFSCWAMGQVFEARNGGTGEMRFPDIHGFIYVHNPGVRKTYDGRDSVLFAAARNSPASEEIAGVMREMSQSFYPGGVLRHPKDVFLPPSER